MVRSPVHGSTFAKNDLAMAAGIATLDVIEAEGLVENAAKVGEGILSDLRGLVGRYDFVREVRGKGLIQAIEFGRRASSRTRPPTSCSTSRRRGCSASS